MAGWRVGFACGNPQMIHALKRIKSYLDYGMPQAIQIGAIAVSRAVAKANRALVNSTQSDDQKRDTAARIRSGEIRLLYLAPERLLSPRTLDFLTTIPISFFSRFFRSWLRS